MSIDISTLGVTYGVSVSGATVAAILNSNNDVAITGLVIASSAVTIANSDLILSGSGSIQATGDITINSITRLSEVTLSPTGSYVINLNLSGAILDSCTVTRSSFWQLSNCTVTAITATRAIRGNCSGCTITNNSFNAGPGEDVAFKLGGAPNYWRGIPVRTNWKSNKNNIIQFNDITDSSGGSVEELTGWDIMDGGITSCRGTVAAVAGNVITVNVVQTKDNDDLIVTDLDPLVLGESAVGTHVLVASGECQGNYYEVTAHNGTNDDLALDASRFSLAGLQVGDHVLIGSAFVDNDFSHNTLSINANTTATALSVFAGAYGNTCDLNSITNTHSTRSGIAIGDLSYALKESGADNTIPANQYDWRLNAHNSYTGNTTNGFTRSFLAITYGTWVTSGPYWNVLTAPDQFKAFGISAVGNSFEPGTILEVLNIKEAVWENNGGLAPSTVDNLLNTGQTDTTWASYIIGGDAAPPTVTSFTISATSSSLIVPITTLTATDDVEVTGYLITESATPPSAEAAGWSSTALASYTFDTAGSKTLYAWAKDEAGNVSAGVSAGVTITLPSTGSQFTDASGNPSPVSDSTGNPMTFYGGDGNPL